MTEPKDATAGHDLLNALVQKVGTMNMAELAASAFVQACMNEACVQGLVTLIRSKNLIGEAEITKAIADAYIQRARQVREQGLAMPNKAIALPRH